MTEAAKLPTNLRPAKFLEGDDPQLAAAVLSIWPISPDFLVQAGTQPANLQGIWNESMTPPWDPNTRSISTPR